MKYAKALEIIKAHEGCKLHAYLDTGGVWTIGYGTTQYPNGAKVRPGDVILQEAADNFLDNHCQEMEKHIRASIKFPDLLSDNQMNAICSWTYNIGNHAEATSTLIRKLNLLSPLVDSKEEFEEVGNQFLRWDFDNGKREAGLTKRREAERALFLS